MNFEVLNKRLKEKGLNQKDLAEQLEVTQAAISQWKKRDGKLRIETFEKILDILDVGADELLGRERPETEHKEKLTEEQKYLIKLTNQFNDEYMEKLIEQAEMYAIRQKEKEKSFNFQSPEKNNAS